VSETGRNGLRDEKSPFLLHGAAQPVDWLPWGGAAFERARAEDRPILLDIGAVWCHWCHVMDRESYEDDATASLINELFVPVKVDRDERPDVDARYQRAVQLLTGQGGWPLTAFLTPDGEVFYGGTYFPPVDAHGRPSFTRVLREVARVWRDDRARALDAATQIGDRLAAAAGAEARAGDIDGSIVADTLEELAQNFDFRWGGFGRAPKFPNAGALDLLLDEQLDAGTDWARRIVSETLHAMIAGGFHDQLGGGFHRYSVDARWIIPHFEKMAYDNGVLLATCARTYAATQDDVLRDAAAGVVAHYHDIAPALLEAGGFPASQDADHSPDDDGDYWTWTRAEVSAVLRDPELERTAFRYFGFDDPASAMHLDRTRHVLFRALSMTALAHELGIPEAEAVARVERIRSALKAARDARPAPYVDVTLYAGWVALAAAGFIAAARFAHIAGAADTALRALERVWREGWREDVGMLHRIGDEGSGTHLEDQALILLALIDAFELTQQPHWLERADRVAAVLRARFADPATGALRDLPRDAAPVVAALDRAYFPIADAPAPSGNGAAALGLLRLHAYSGAAQHDEAARAILRAFAGSAAQLGSAAATWVKALAWATRPVTTVVIVEDSGGGLLAEALRSYRPRTVVRRFAPGAVAAEQLPAELRAMVDAAAPRAYLCAGRTCAAPVSDAPALAALLREFRG
jgi:uncharacterized protein YyaL (SSP411 family)